eukprot:5315655-Prymnesium_polylepis.1
MAVPGAPLSAMFARSMSSVHRFPSDQTQCRFCLRGRTIANVRACNELIKLLDTGVYTPRAIGLSR